MRLISIDTETTGSSPAKGDRCVEIGAVELIDGRLTGRTFQTYLNPDRKVAWQAERVHGLSNRFLADKPRLAEVAPDLLDFIGGAPCFAHNARFDRDMLLYDFRHAELEVPDLRFFDTIPLAKAHVRSTAYRLDVLAQTLGLIDTARGLHGALEDATILARVIETIETRKPGAINRWIDRTPPLSPLPKGWPGPAAASQAKDLPGQKGQAPAPTGSEEQEEADRVAELVRSALTGVRDLGDLANRLTAAGVLIRPVINADMVLHGVRFSTPKTSFTGGKIGLTGPALERAGAAYVHAEHAGLVERLVQQHDRVMGDVAGLGSRFTRTPRTAAPAQTSLARDRVAELVRAALARASTVFELADLLEADGVRTETRIDAKRMRVSSVLFVAEGARVPGTRVGLGPRDQGAGFWSLEPGPPVKQGPDGRVRAPSPTLTRNPEMAPLRIGSGLNPGVASVIAEVNAGTLEISPETVRRLRSGRDLWSAASEDDLRKVVRSQAPECAEEMMGSLPEKDQGFALRWVCRGMNPERVVAFHQVRAAVYEARSDEPEPSPSSDPEL